MRKIEVPDYIKYPVLGGLGFTFLLLLFIIFASVLRGAENGAAIGFMLYLTLFFLGLTMSVWKKVSIVSVIVLLASLAFFITNVDNLTAAVSYSDSPLALNILWPYWIAYGLPIIVSLFEGGKKFKVMWKDLKREWRE